MVTWIDSSNESLRYLSAITIGEVNRGIQRLPNSTRKQQLRSWLDEQLLTRFAGRILSIDAATMLAWGDIVADLESRGRVLPAKDSLILASARHHGLTVVTRNVGDFAGTRVDVLNRWDK